MDKQSCERMFSSLCNPKAIALANGAKPDAAEDSTPVKSVAILSTKIKADTIFKTLNETKGTERLAEIEFFSKANDSIPSSKGGAFYMQLDVENTLRDYRFVRMRDAVGNSELKGHRTNAVFWGSSRCHDGDHECLKQTYEEVKLVALTLTKAGAEITLIKRSTLNHDRDVIQIGTHGKYTQEKGYRPLSIEEISSYTGEDPLAYKK